MGCLVTRVSLLRVVQIQSFVLKGGGGGTLSSVCSGREGGREGGEKTGRAVSSLSPKDSLRIGPISRRKND